MAKLFLTDRAMDDLADLSRYSLQQFGLQVADRYMAQIDQALKSLREEPTLLRERADCPGPLRFYRINKHWLVCDVMEGHVFVLTVKHAAMDLPARLRELEPTLQQDVEVIRRRIAGR